MMPIELYLDKLVEWQGNDRTYYNGMRHYDNRPPSPVPSHQPRHLFMSSPDVSFGFVDPSVFTSSTIETELEMSGDHSISLGVSNSSLSENPTINLNHGKWSNTDASGSIKGNGDSYPRGIGRLPGCKAFVNCEEYTAPATKVRSTIKTTPRILPNGIDQGSEDQIDTNFFRPWTRWMSSGIEMVSNDDIPYPSDNYKFELGLHNKAVANNDSSGSVYFDIADVSGTSLKVNLFNIYVDNQSQYGGVGSGQHLLAGRKKVGGNNYNGIFGGDTFITKYHHMNESQIPWRFNFERNNESDDATSSYSWNYPDVGPSRQNVNDGRVILTHPDENKSGTQTSEVKGLTFVSSIYYFVESEVNTYLRHRTKGDSRSFIPHDDYNSSYQKYEGYLGNSANYNPQYSQGNAVKVFSSSLSSQVVSKFENRIIYSTQASNDDLLDAYRVFNQNDYYDLPAHTGAIWNLFTSFNKLYAHTPKSLWETFAEPAATLNSEDIGDVVLGTGKLFQRPSKEMMTGEGGYGGTLSQFGGVETIFGYVYIDALQKKIFALTPNSDGKAVGLRELSLNTISQFLANDLNDMLEANPDNGHLIDNPYMGIGYTGAFDHRLGMAYISKLGESPWTLGFSTKNNAFFGFYSYRPDALIPYNNRMLEFKDGEVWEHNKGDKNTFYGNLEPSYLEIVSGVSNQQAKVFDNLVIDTEQYETDGSRIGETFDNLEVNTNFVGTGSKTIQSITSKRDKPTNGDIAAINRNAEFRIAIPKGADRSRIKGDFAKIRLSYNKGKRFIIRQIMTIIRVNNG